MMPETLKEAIQEAERFLVRAKALQKDPEGFKYLYSPHAQRAAVKRASMDLTRALAKLRRSN